MEPNSTAKDFIKKAVDLRGAGRVDEAVLAAKQAVNLDGNDANAWWQLALATWDRSGAVASIPHLAKTVELADGFAHGWHLLGDAHNSASISGKAIECWERAVEMDTERSDTWLRLADAYALRNETGDEEKQFEALKAVERLGAINGPNWIKLGNGYFKRKQHQLAIRCYKRHAAEVGGWVAFYNLGLSLASQEVQQQTDAIDAWRRALLESDNNGGAEARLKDWLPESLELRQRVLQRRRALLSQDDWYSTYVNPYDLLDLMGDGELEDIDAKAVQKAKKNLLQEIELEDGLVEWMQGLKIDRSRAIKIADDLMDETIASYHRVVAENPELASFLSRGEIDFFLVEPDSSPIDLLEKFEDDLWDFASWLSENFSAQYNFVLSKAFETRDVDAIEALLSGRRLVLPEHEDRCFEGAQRQVARMIAPLEKAREAANDTKPSISEVKALLDSDNLGRIVSLLPQYFQSVQNQLAGMIRSISIDCHNKHDDTDLAKEILQIGKSLARRSPAMLRRIEEDEKTLDTLLAEQSKHEATLNFRGERYSITRNSVVFGTQTIPVQDVRAVRFGIVGKQETSGPTLSFNMDVVAKDDKRISIAWTSYKDLETQEALFRKLQEAALNYLIPSILKNLEHAIDSDHKIKVGTATCDKTGVLFEIAGWFSSRQVVCPWHRLKVTLEGGRLTLADPSERKAVHYLPLATTDNALALYFLINKYQS
ncbi:MAG: tetratricopeptide repeat protein [Roseomonas sp.]|nr:tetratricopeptide repeat protein [Roseomonas sp.]